MKGVLEKIDHEKKLLFSITKKDFKIDYFSGTGGGGQHRNKHQNCVRLHHNNSKVMVTGQSHKEQRSNMKEAFNNLVNHPKFKIWLNQKIYEVVNEKKIENVVEEMMKPENIIVEVKKNKKWIKEGD